MQTYRTYAIRETNFMITQFLGMKNVGRSATATIILPCSEIDSSKGTVTVLAELFCEYLGPRSNRVYF